MKIHITNSNQQNFGEDPEQLEKHELKWSFDIYEKDLLQRGVIEEGWIADTLVPQVVRADAQLGMCR